MKRTNIIKLSAFIILMITTSSIAPAQNWQLVWADEFNGDQLDMNNWSYEYGNGQNGWGTGQDDYCTDREENVKVSDGTLKLTLRNDGYNGYDYTSGRIRTHGKVAFKYGKIEARVRVPAGRGIGAAFWMLPEKTNLGWWPTSGEIDIVETNGDELQRNYGTVHFEQWGMHMHNGNAVHIKGDISKDFHTYWIEWDEEAIKWFVDGRQYHEFNIKEPVDGVPVFHDPFYIILSTGVGSQFSGDIIDDYLLPQSMEFDYVRVYQQFDYPEPKMAKTNGGGNMIELYFTEAMQPPADSLINSFTIHANGKIMPIKSISLPYRDNTGYIFQLKTPIPKNASTTISYNGNNHVLSNQKQPLKPFKEHFVANKVLGSNPVISNAITINHHDVELSFSKGLKVSEAIDTSSFTLKVNGITRPIVSAKITQFNTKIVLHINQLLLNRDQIILSYKGDYIYSNDGGTLQPVEDMPVNNNLPDTPIIPCKLEAEAYTKAEGIRAEKTNDEGGGKNIGYIDDYDWLEYKVYVENEGEYIIDYRVSSEKGGAVIELQNDNRPVAKTKIPSTESWQKWIIVSSDPVALTQGIHTIKLYAKRGGFNVN